MAETRQDRVVDTAHWPPRTRHRIAGTAMGIGPIPPADAVLERSSALGYVVTVTLVDRHATYVGSLLESSPEDALRLATTLARARGRRLPELGELPLAAV